MRTPRQHAVPIWNGCFIGGQRHRGREKGNAKEWETEWERRGWRGVVTRKRKPRERRWYGTFVSNPIPHTIWLHYHYAGEKTSVSLKIKTYLAPSKLTPNETCLSPCDSVSVIALLLNSSWSVQIELAAAAWFQNVCMHACTWSSECVQDRDRAVSQWLIITEESP